MTKQREERGYIPQRFSEKHQQRPLHAGLHQPPKVCAVFVAKPRQVPIIVMLFPQFLRLLPEKPWLVRFRDEVVAQRPKKHTHYQDDPIRPPPTQSLEYEATNNGTQNRPVHDGKTEKTECQRSVFLAKYIPDRARGVRERDRADKGT